MRYWSFGYSGIVLLRLLNHWLIVIKEIVSFKNLSNLLIDNISKPIPFSNFKFTEMMNIITNKLPLLFLGKSTPLLVIWCCCRLWVHLLQNIKLINIIIHSPHPNRPNQLSLFNLRTIHHKCFIVSFISFMLFLEGKASIRSDLFIIFINVEPLIDVLLPIQQHLQQAKQHPRQLQTHQHWLSFPLTIIDAAKRYNDGWLILQLLLIIPRSNPIWTIWKRAIE